MTALPLPVSLSRLGGPESAPTVWEAPEPRDVLGRFLATRRKATTRDGYASDAGEFAFWLGRRLGRPELDAAEAVGVLLSGGRGAAFECLATWQSEQNQAGYPRVCRKTGRRYPAPAPLSAATINRRVCCLRSIVKFASDLGVIEWSLPRLASLDVTADVRGPDREQVAALLAAAVERPVRVGARRKGRKTAASVLARRRRLAKLRDVALLQLLAGMALRRGEVASLDVGHYDGTTGTLRVLRKGKSSRVVLTVPTPCRAALAAWLRAHPSPKDPSAPLFVSVDNRAFGARLSGSGIYRAVQAAGRAVGLKVRPHKLRHSAITTALDLSGGDIRRVARFSGHASLSMVLTYDDARTDVFGELAEVVAGAFTAQTQAVTA